MTTTSTRRRNPRPSVEVFNPQPWCDDPMAFGQPFHFEPESTVEIGDLYDWPRDDQTNRLITTGHRDIVMAAYDVAEFICSAECRGKRGFVILEGTPEERERQKAEAIQTWAEEEVGRVEEKIANWEAYVQRAVSAAPGMPAPRQPKDVTRAYAWRKKYLRAQDARSEFVCRFCGFETGDQGRLQAHLVEEHPGAVPMLAPSVPAVPGPAIAVASPPEPSAQDPGQEERIRLGAVLMDQVAQQGFPISVADRKGLEHGDPDVLSDVRARAMAAAKERVSTARRRGRAVVAESADQEDAEEAEA